MVYIECIDEGSKYINFLSKWYKNFLYLKNITITSTYLLVIIITIKN